MPHNGFIYEARMDMMENSGHWLNDTLMLSHLIFSVPDIEIRNKTLYVVGHCLTMTQKNITNQTINT